MCCSILQCVIVYCSVLQCVAVCCYVLQRDAVCCSALRHVSQNIFSRPAHLSGATPPATFHCHLAGLPSEWGCNVLQYVAAHIAVCCSVCCSTPRGATPPATFRGHFAVFLSERGCSVLQRVLQHTSELHATSHFSQPPYDLAASCVPRLQ